ncbi:hypothetical protein NI17_022975 [Thermobifida halotolerans]|uniref:Lipoprotein n=1 Tax=Thermobifida halotolerans TaxID=483545 RepID=A0AA97M420_9ACTN|nr:hypothetical protein [Thermobifida halotolerans]UOE19540.1 hypothetical protein NI17_022975 [Thermobifida halotolerans]
MRTVRAAAFPLAAAVLAVPACGFGAPSQVLPGLAHPMASADSGFHVTDEDTLHDYNGINLVLPAGWHVDIADNCLSPPGVVPGPGGGCPATALRIRPDASADGIIDSGGADLEDPDRWRRPWASCPQDPGVGEQIRAEDAEITEHGEFVLVSGEQAEYSEWTVTCTGGGSFRTRAWYVAEVDLEFDVPVMLDDAADGYDAIVRSTDLSRYKQIS